jgi:hypothetical protein
MRDHEGWPEPDDWGFDRRADRGWPMGEDTWRTEEGAGGLGADLGADPEPDRADIARHRPPGPIDDIRQALGAVPTRAAAVFALAMVAVMGLIAGVVVISLFAAVAVAGVLLTERG